MERRTWFRRTKSSGLTPLARRTALALVESLEPRMLLSGLALDTAYGTGGRVITDLNANGISDDYVTGAAVQADGKVVVVGSTDAPGANNAKWTVLRYNTDGSRDISFGQNGLTTYYGGSYTRGDNAVIQSDGKIVVTGEIIHFNNSATTYESLVARYNTNGTLDTGFGTAGIVDLGGGTPGGLALMAGGKILITGVGGTGMNASSWATLWELNGNGTADLSFGQNGIVTYDQNLNYQQVTAPLRLPDDSFLALTPLGIVHFSSSGTNLGYFGAPSTLVQHQLVRQPDGKIIEQYASAEASPKMLITRFNADGTVDPTFGINGTTTIDFNGNANIPAGLFLQANGDIVLGGTVYGSSVVQDFACARLLPNGTPDETFGLHGLWRDPFGDAQNSGSADFLITVLPSPDGSRFYSIGRTTQSTPEDVSFNSTANNIAIIRYATDAPLTVNAGGPYGPVNEGSTFAASAASSTYVNGPIVKYEWDTNYTGGIFNPVVTSTSPSAVLTAVDGPVAHIFVRVTTADGLQAVGPVNVTVRNVAPTVTLPSTLLVFVPGVSSGLPITVTDPSALDTQTVTIDWGDNTVHDSYMFSRGTIGHTYTARGTYTITVMATDKDGGVSAPVTAVVKVTDVAGLAFYDLNDNGVLNAGESAWVGAAVFLDTNGNGQPDAGEPQTTTDALGYYAFDDLAPGTYTLRPVLPSGYRVSTPRAGFTTFTITASRGARIDLGATQRSAITGTLFTDLNANGVRDANETGYNQLIEPYVDLNGNGKLDANEPSAYGPNYTLTNLDPGTYTVLAVVPSGWRQTTPAGIGYTITVGAAQLATAPLLGHVQSNASIAGIVFNDANQSGSKQSTEPGVGGRTVYIDSNSNGTFDSGELSAITASDGSYKIPGLLAGTYTVRTVVPPAWTQTYPAANGGITVTVTAGQSNLSTNFGEFPLPIVTAESVVPTSGGFILAFTFASDLHTSLGTNDLVLYDMSTGNPIASGAAALSYDLLKNIATFTNVGGPSLPPGVYQAKLLAAGINDVYGNHLDGNADGVVGDDHLFSFYTAAGANTFAIRKDADAVHADITLNGASVKQLPLSQSSAFSITGTTGNDTLTLDFSNGNPLPAGGISFDGGAGINTVSLIGTSGDDTLIANATGLTFTGGTFSNVPITADSVQVVQLHGGSGGNDSINLTGGNYTVDADTAIGTTPNVSVTIQAAANATFATDQHLADLTINGLLDITTHFVYLPSTPANFTAVQQYWVNGYNINSAASQAAGLLGDWTGRGGFTNASGKADYAGGASPGNLKRTIGVYDGAYFAANGVGAGVLANEINNTSPNLAANQILIRPTLAGDMNGDGKVDDYDILIFNTFGRYLAGPNSNRLGTEAGDLNGDGRVDDTDILIFNTAGNYLNGNSPSVFSGAAALDAVAPAARATPQTVAHHTLRAGHSKVHGQNKNKHVRLHGKIPFTR